MTKQSCCLSLLMQCLSMFVWVWE